MPGSGIGGESAYSPSNNPLCGFTLLIKQKRMKTILLIFSLLLNSMLENCFAQADTATYLQDIKTALTKQWPKNRAINLVFHGHSVPSGYFKTPDVRTLDAYPNQLLKELKALYPYAVINVIVTAIGGENSVNGEKRFKSEVLIHKPDVLFIDYALNDRGMGLEKSKEAWEKMIKEALQNNIKVILLSPSADQRVDLKQPNNALQQFTDQIRELAKKYQIGFSDSYSRFAEKAISAEGVVPYMSQVNHPNEQGHQLIVQELVRWFK